VITLVLGGARSGKSQVAERLAAAAGGPVVYVATGLAEDPDFAARIAAHRGRRPPGWTTVEGAGLDLAEVVRGTGGVVVVDSLTTWVAAGPDFAVDAGGLCRALVGRDGDAVVVSDEVGLGVHPSSPVGRRFRDALGLVNQAVAAVADDVLLVVAGRALRLEPA
jgi:adenosylcobinamide kinase / adenosylcobinamide-phosphate guanylyltransferase